MTAITEPGFSSEFPFQRDMNAGNTVRFLTISSFGLFVNQVSLLETDWGWVGTGHHCQRPAFQFGHHLRWTGLH